MNLSRNLLKTYVPFTPFNPLFLTLRQFPPYLEKPPSPLSDEDRKRYDLQVDCIRRVLAVFDDAGYDDKDAECQQKIGDLMAEVCCASCYGSLC
jgi:peroxin-19